MSAGFHVLKIAEVRREIEDAVSLRFELPDALRGTFAFTPGQHLTLRTEIDGEDVRRNYSICAAPHERELRVAIKQIPGGAFSTWANGSLAVGGLLEAMPSHGSFTWAFDAGARRTYAGFAGGSGITPILSLLKTALQVESGSEFVLLYGNRASGSIMFLEELAALKNRFMGRFQIYHFLEEEEEEVDLFKRPAGREQDRRGAGVPGRPEGDRRRLHLRPRADDGRGGGGTAHRRGRSPRAS